MRNYNIELAINSGGQDINKFRTLLSLGAEEYLEAMAQKAHSLTLNNFGRTIQIYTPMYLSNFCQNQCAYCGFNALNNVPRKKLTLKEVEKEAIVISSTELNHILILTGESREMSPVQYIKDCVSILRKYFSLISIEIYALTESEYTDLINSGVDGLTMYQETYDQALYDTLHQVGPKKDYVFRLAAPERAARAGIRAINIGVLLGLGDWRKDVFLMGLHAKNLQDKFPDVEIGVSVPRLRPAVGDFKINNVVSDINMVQIITALRIFLPRVGISISTRENSEFRENLIPLGITRMSAGSSTQVGGYIARMNAQSNPYQFEISDTRSVEEIKTMLTVKGYQAILKDWVRI